MTSTDMPHVTRPESVTDRLRADILSGRLAPGERLIELSLCDHYACGRGALRSALIELSTEGLIEREANRGATVRRISIDEALQITEARAALEGLIAAYAARNATEADRVELAELMNEMGSAAAESRALDYSQLNARFHTRLREISGHTVAAELVDNLRNRSAHHQYRLALVPGRPNESIDQHRAIASAVIEGDETAAAAAMRAHLASVIEALQQWTDFPRL